MLRIEVIEDKGTWDDFIKSFSPSNILQSWGWGEFQQSLGRKIWRIGVFDDEQLKAAALVQLIPTRLRTHLYVSNGPVFDPVHARDVLPTLIGHLKALGIQEKVKFVRMDPLLESTRENRILLKELGLTKSGTHTQAENKWILDIAVSEETLLAGMKKSTRYEVKKSEKEGVMVEASTDLKDYEKFEELFKQTVKRQRFIPHPMEYYRKQFMALTQQGMYRVYLARKGRQILAAALISFYGDSAAYLHAASLNNRDANRYMAPQALVWKAIKDAKEQGCKYFDFWGVAKNDDPKDPWAGFTRFKKGFGGSELKVVRARDIPIAPEYPILALLDSTRELWGGIYYRFFKK
jgi:lipid II:glycine glycyltransferase (peptidoglycan interpeptide bridge formation enzyme)